MRWFLPLLYILSQNGWKKTLPSSRDIFLKNYSNWVLTFSKVAVVAVKLFALKDFEKKTENGAKSANNVLNKIETDF